MIVPYGLASGARIISPTTDCDHPTQETHYEVGNPGSD
jgi:hypothetical protein